MESFCFCGVFAEEFGGFFEVFVNPSWLYGKKVSGRRSPVSTAVSPAVCGSSDALDRISGSRTSKALPRQAALWPKRFWTLRALSGVLKASSEPPRPRFGASSGRNRREGLTP